MYRALRVSSSLRLLPIAWLAVLGACAQDSPPPNQPPADLQVPVERLTLDNGLEVLVQTNRTVPTVTALIVVRAGAFYEDEETNGYAHLFEHMIFKGSQALPDDVEFRRRLDATGASYNASTYVDWVRYYVSASKERVGEALGLMADALREPLLAQEELDKEIQVVLDEFDLRLSTHDWLQRRAMLQRLWGDALTRLDALGSREAVKAATVSALRAAHEAHYRPGNAVLVLSGDIDRGEARRLANEHLGGWRGSGPVEPAAPLELPAFTRSAAHVLELPVAQSTLLLGVRLPGYEEEPEASTYADLLSEVVLQTDHPFRSLVGPGRAFGAGLGFQVFRGAGYLYGYAQVPFGEETAVLWAMRQEMDALGRRGTTTEDQFARAQDILWQKGFAQRSDPFDAAFALGSAWIREDVDGFEGLTAKLYAKSLGQMREFAARHLTERPAVAVLLTSEDNAREHALDAAALRELL